MIIPNIWENKEMFQNTNQCLLGVPYLNNCPSRMDHHVATWKASAKVVIKSEGLAVARWRSLAVCRWSQLRAAWVKSMAQN